MLSDKFIKKYMRIAKVVGEDQNPCYSRQIGTVIVDPIRNAIIGTGYNGPPKGTPHCDNPVYLQDIVWPQLTMTERAMTNCNDAQEFKKMWGYTHTCPRRIIGANSGERLELSSCEHSERNSIYNATGDTNNCYMFAFCLLPCWDCTKAIINAGISKVYCLKEEKDYSFGARWLFEQSKVEIVERDKEWYLQTTS